MSLPADAYARQLRQLLPPGSLWLFEPGSWLARLLQGIADGLARIDARADDLVNEWDPRTAVECLSDWERVLGLPDGTVLASSTVLERQLNAARKFASLGGSPAAYFIGMAARLGFVATVLDGADPYVWRLVVDLGKSTSPFPLRASVFRAGSARAGDNLMSWAIPELESVINREKPAHTLARFAYLVSVNPSIAFITLLAAGVDPVAAGAIVGGWGAGGGGGGGGPGIGGITGGGPAVPGPEPIYPFHSGATINIVGTNLSNAIVALPGLNGPIAGTVIFNSATEVHVTLPDGVISGRLYLYTPNGVTSALLDVTNAVVAGTAQATVLDGAGQMLLT